MGLVVAIGNSDSRSADSVSRARMRVGAGVTAGSQLDRRNKRLSSSESL